MEPPSFALSLLLCLAALLLCGVSLAALVKLRSRPWRLKLFPVLAPLVQVLMLLLSCAVFLSSHRFSYEMLALAAIVAAFACVATDVALLRSTLEAAEAELSANRAHVASEQAWAQRLHAERARGEVRRVDSVREEIAADLRALCEKMDKGDFSEAEADLLAAERRLPRRRLICGHLEVSALLELKRAECEEAGVRCSFDVRLPADVGVSAVDLCSLFSNMIDNALNAASCARGEARFVEAKARCDLGLLILSVRNGLADEGAGSGAASIRDEKPACASLAGDGRVSGVVSAADSVSQTVFQAGDGRVSGMVQIAGANRTASPAEDDVSPSEGAASPAEDGAPLSSAGRAADASSAAGGSRFAEGEENRSPVRRVDGHGWGTGILEELAKRYGGSFKTECRDGIWIATAVLELP